MATEVSTYVGREERSMESLPTNALIPALCITRARIRLELRRDLIFCSECSIIREHLLCIDLDRAEQQNGASPVLYQSLRQSRIDFLRKGRIRVQAFFRLEGILVQPLH